MSDFSNSIINQKIRQRKIFITSIGQADGSDSSSFYARLEEDILVEDGFSLVVGVSSFGFKNSAWNISEQQKNNKLKLKLLYNNGNEQELIIIIPDGMYGSLNDIFSILSSNQLYYIDSGFSQFNIPTTDRVEDPLGDNILKIFLLFQQTSYGYSLGLQVEDKECDYNMDQTDPSINRYSNANYLKSITILPHDEDPLLYNILFTNTISESTPSEINHSITNVANNPPESIKFIITKYPIDNPVNYDPNGTFFPFPEGKIIYDIYEHSNLDSENEYYQNNNLPFKGIPWKAYFTPEFNPSHIDLICSDLHTLNMTTTGISKNVIHRQFLNGSDENLSSVYQYFDTPVWMVQGNRERISSLFFKFVAEGNKWIFYNMRFDIQLQVFEVPDEKLEAQEQPDTFVLPGQDALTDLVNVYTGVQRNPYGAHDIRGKRGYIQFGGGDGYEDGDDNFNNYSNSNSNLNLKKKYKKRR